MKPKHVALALLAAAPLVIVAPGLARAADYHHVHITMSSPAKGVEWYTEHMGCEPVADRDDVADCGGVEVVFVLQAATGGSQGTGINHIGFSFPRPDGQDGGARSSWCPRVWRQAAEV